MSVLIKLTFLVTIAQCLWFVSGESSENSLTNNPSPLLPPQPPLAPTPPAEESRFQKFLSLFGISSSHNQLDRNDLSRAYQQYGYPCAISTTTTTTPSPVLTPLLCPYPPMLPPQFNSQQQGQGHVNTGGQGQGQIMFPPGPHASNLEQVYPPPSPSGGSQHPFLRPPPPKFPPQFDFHGKPQSQSPLPELIPLVPAGSHPPHYYVPPGLKPDQLLPTPPSFPSQNVPTPNPIQNLPHPPPVQPSQVGLSTPPLTAFPVPLIPSNIENPDKPQDPSLALTTSVASDSEKPVLINTGSGNSIESPVQVTPVVNNPLNPVKVTPSVLDPSKPVQVNPVNFNPATNPLVIDPVQNQQGGLPLFVNPSNDQPLIIDALAKPPFDSKGFSKYPPQFRPYGPLNVLINPGIPEKTFTKPTGIPLQNTDSGKVEKPIKPGKFPQPPPVENEAAINPGLPLNDGYTIIGPIQGPLPSHFLNSNALIIGTYVPNGVDQLPPPLNFPPNFVVQPPPSSSVSPPPPNKVPSVSPSPVNQSSVLSSAPVQFPPPKQPQDPFVGGVPPCGSPFLRSYVPPGFHLTSVNQFIGLPTVPNSRFVYPCQTVDLLKSLDFKIMRSLILESGLLPLFEHTRNYTLFVPPDVAFRRLPRWFRDSLEVDKKLKKALVLNHLVKEDLPLEMLDNEELVLTARPGGNRIRVNIYQASSSYRTITVDGSEVEKGDILTSNGRIHIVNKVLMPNLPRNAAQFLSEKLEFESFWNLIKRADLIESFQHPRPFTIFIPVNAAVDRLNDTTFLSDIDKLRNFINYHVVNGSYYSSGLINNEFLLTNYEKEIKLQVVSDSFARSISGINGNVRILKSDITLTNGVAHIIDRCISEDSPFYVYPQSDEFRNEYGVMKRSFRVTGEEKNISNSF